jgi:glycolate oxidase FAD binding subunit
VRGSSRAGEGPEPGVAAKRREALGALLGEEGVTEHGPSGLPLALPTSAEEVGALFRAARERGWRVRPTGSGIGLDLLPGGGARVGPSSEPDLLVGSARMGGVLDYEPADLTLRAGAGTTLQELDRILRAEAQWLPLDPPGGGAVTLGGVVATGVAGPLSPGFGRPRDQVLGLGMVDGRGKSLALGGRVVKNVAGFDLVRLATGSRGALGFVHEVSLRLFPRPRVDRTLEWSVADGEEALALGRRLAALPLSFASLELLDDPGAEGAGGPRVLLRLVDSAPAADRLEAEAVRVAGPPSTRLEGDDSATAAQARSWEEGIGSPSLRLQGLPDAVDEVLRALARTLPEAAARMTTGVRLLTGTVRLWGRGDAPPGLLEGCEALTRALAPMGATARVLRPGTAGLRRAEGHRIGPASADGVRRLQREIRRAFDPHGILPGAWREGWEG